MVQNNLYFGSTLGHQPYNWNDPAAVGGVIGDTASFTIQGGDENWGMVLPFNISKIEVQGEQDSGELVGNLYFGATCEALSVNDNILSQLSVYPNPTNAKLTVTGYSYQTIYYSISNVLGQQVLSGSKTSDTLHINLSELESQVYFLKINDKIFKIIKSE